jgi:bacterioferritin-associated ferredoxin/NifU-like protein involved in Fe-S cluster formation
VTHPHEGPLADADAVGESGSMSNGPGVRIALRFDGDVVRRAAFETCALEAARPVAEALCALIEGGTADDASQVSVTDVARVGGVAPASVAARTVHFAKSAALQTLLGRRARHGTSLTCTCFHVPTQEIVATIRRHRVRTVESLRAHLPVTTGCGTCRPEVQKLLDDESKSS